MNTPVLRILSSGLGATAQDAGRPGWKRFGVPPGGAMDEHAAMWANRLLDNDADAPLLELLLQGARVEMLRDCWVALTGADAGAGIPTWRALRVTEGDVIEFPRARAGVWSYLAVDGGFAAPHWLHSASAYPRANLGMILKPSDELARARAESFHLPPGVAGRTIAPEERRDYEHSPALRVWPAPQWNDFDETERAKIFSQAWSVTSQCDRVGYRLAGEALRCSIANSISEPTLAGTVQIPPGGQPIVTMRDGPTVGGYPKLAVIDAADVSWLAQCQPGQKVRFQLHPDPAP
ncbi:MAG: biotin-dependent carboxyltransferase [Verrucomicrobia bacterium]|nr:biotin-dependent carboxyltransferase [Verrucomicrobiota bacterium]